jgi:hypothetical protein
MQSQKERTIRAVVGICVPLETGWTAGSMHLCLHCSLLVWACQPSLPACLLPLLQRLLLLLLLLPLLQRLPACAAYPCL